MDIHILLRTCGTFHILSTPGWLYLIFTSRWFIPINAANKFHAICIICTIPNRGLWNSLKFWILDDTGIPLETGWSWVFHGFSGMVTMALDLFTFMSNPSPPENLWLFHSGESQVQLLLRLKQHDRAYLRSLLFFFAMPQLGRPSIYIYSWSIIIYPHLAQPPGETSHDYRLVSRRQPQQPRFPRRILGSEAWRRCIWRLRKATPPWSSSWSLRGPRWTWPTTTAVALVWAWLWRGDGRVSYIGSWFSCCALGCWVVLVLVV